VGASFRVKFFRARPRLLAEGGNGFFLGVVYLEEVEKADHLQRLDGVTLGLHQLDVPAQLPRVGVAADENADSAGINHGNLSQIDEHARVAVFEGLFKSLPKRIHRLAESEPAPQTKDLNIGLPENRKIHPSLPFVQVPTAFVDTAKLR
jgi:hypothetical protein